ncbi:hypothetical protein L0F63_003487 [Massospora cicadina]|nr:hypothetical protein L0F63_003487 [Massospora cicadina]
MCALHNGIYILNCAPKEIELPCSDAKSRITTRQGQVLTSTSLVLNVDYLPSELHENVQITGYVARMVVALDRHDISDEVSLVVFPQKAFDTPAPIFGLVLSNDAACPQALIHLWTVLPKVSQDDYLSPVLKLIAGSDVSVIFKMKYFQAIRRFQRTSSITNLVVCDDPSPDLTLESLIPLTKFHFQRLAEGGEFFPPKPEVFDVEL